MKNIDLIRKIAWIYHRKTGLDWDELFQDIALKYYESLENYDPSKGTITTYMWQVMCNHFKNYLREQQIHRVDTIPIEDAGLHNTDTNLFDRFGPEAQCIARTILARPELYSQLSPRRAIRWVRKVLVRNGYNRHRVNIGIRELKLIFGSG